MEALVEAANAALRAAPRGDAWFDTGLEGMRIRRVMHQRPLVCHFQGPLCSVIVQGAKEVDTGGRRINFIAGDAMIVSQHIPAVTRVVDGSPQRPYLAAILPLDLALLAALEHGLGDAMPADQIGGAIEVMRATPEMAAAFARLLALAATPVEARILAPLVAKEIHLRFLLAPQGAILRALLSRDSQASRISRVIAHIRQADDPAGCSVDALARIAGMGTSSLHAHFKAVTGMTPLGFQKELRLMRARDLLLDPEQSVTSVAFAVGYESPTQFSREYARRFGASPRKHREQVAS